MSCFIPFFFVASKAENNVMLSLDIFKIWMQEFLCRVVESKFDVCISDGSIL